MVMPRISVLNIESQGRYQLSPLYDVISAYPIAAKKQIEWQQLKMAMSLQGKSRHYLWNTFQLRHWLAMAEKCQLSTAMIQDLINEVCDTMENVISQVTRAFTSHTFLYISQIQYFSGMREIQNRCTNQIITGK